jgi:hypothetical protein
MLRKLSEKRHETAVLQDYKAKYIAKNLAILYAGLYRIHYVDGGVPSNNLNIYEDEALLRPNQ